MLLHVRQMEPDQGVEPWFHRYERCALPLDESGMVGVKGIEPPSTGCKPAALPLSYTP